MLKLVFSISLTKNTIDIVSKNLPHKLLSNFKGERKDKLENSGTQSYQLIKANIINMGTN